MPRPKKESLPKAPRSPVKAPPSPERPVRPPEAPPATDGTTLLPTDLSETDFQALWDGLSPKGKAVARERADEWGVTLKAVLHRWPQLRVG